MKTFFNSSFLPCFIFLFALLATTSWGQTSLYSDDFTGEDNKGKVGSNPVDVSGVTWDIDVSNGDFSDPDDFFAVGQTQSGVFEAQDVDGDVFWTSDTFSIDGFTSLEFSFGAAADGDFEAGTDIFEVEIIIDGSPETLFSGTVDESMTGDPMFFGSTQLTATLQSFSTSITGTGTEAYIKITVNNNAGTEFYGWDNPEVTGISGSNNCNITASGLTNITCLDNGTPNEDTDDYIEFDLNPEGSNLGANGYDISSSTTGVTLSPTSGAYGSATTFSTVNSTGWNAGDGDIQITITDTDSATCELNEVVPDPGICSTPPAPELMISQYVDTESGTEPKGIELWNNTGNTLDFSTNNLVVEQGTNGGAPSAEFTLSSGTMGPDEVIVIGTSDIGTYLNNNGHSSVDFYDETFQFNGNDALVIKYGGTTTDILGNPGSDPGSSWDGNGVSTADQNIQLLSSITEGDTDGWTDPSTRFETVSTSPSNSGGLVGFGDAPGVLLPVDWVSFTAQPLEQRVSRLEWSTKNEIDNSHYAIEHSTNGHQWISIGKVDAQQKQHSILHYQFTHENPPTGSNFYRLRQVDRDGMMDYSKIAKVDFTSDQEGRLSPFPNPVEDQLWIQNPGTDIERYVIYDMQGRQQGQFPPERSFIPVQQLQSGAYFLLIHRKGAVTRLRFIVQ